MLFSTAGALAQNPPATGNVPVSMSSGGGQYSSLFANLMNKRTKAEYATVGSPYLYENWTTGTVDIDGQTYVLEQVKLDLIEKALEVVYEGESKYIDANNFTRFTLYDQANDKNVYFTNAKLYKINGKRLEPGIMKVTQVGTYNILTHMKARLVRPSQAQLINGVDPRPKVVKESFIYLEHEGVIFPIRKKKDLEKALRRHAGKLKRYMKENKVNVKNEEDLVGLLIYIQQ